MFEAVLPQGIILKKVIEAIREIVTEVNFEITSDGVSVQAMDASHVALVVLHLDAEKFEEYRCDRPQSIGVAINNFAKFLKLAGNEDEITLRAEDEANVLTLVFRSKHEDKLCEFNLSLMTLDSEHLGIPDTEYTAEVAMSSSEFAKICRELGQITDTLNIMVSKEWMKLAVAGDVGTGAVTLRANDSDKAEERVSIRAVDVIGMAFALRYLNLFNRAASLSEEVSLSLSTDIPVCLRFTFDLGTIEYFLAPKISEPTP